MNYKGKFKRMGKFGGYTNKRRKAIVKLTAESKEIEFFEAYNSSIKKRREMKWRLKSTNLPLTVVAE